MAGYVNGRKVEFGSPEWERGDYLAGLTSPAYAAANGFPNAQTGANAFAPWSPPPIPSGYYDPSLDATRDSASRGLQYTEQDTGLAGRRAGEDFGFANADINQAFSRGTEDIGTQRRYTQEDYDRNVGLLTRQYTQQGRQQAETARKYGVATGGIALMSAAKRNENQAIDRQGLDTGLTRANEGFDTAGTRLTQDRDTGLSRAQTGYDRGVADRGTTLSRARSEDMFFGLDTGQQKAFQATQAGYAAPTGPANEFTKPDGTRYRVVKKNGYRIEYDQNGRVLDRRRA